MKKIVVVTGSVRSVRATDGLAKTVVKKLEKSKEFEVSLADIRELQLPLFDAPVPPSVESFSTDHENVKAWTQTIAQADGVVLLTPEYNAGLSAAQKNAIDWMSKEWKEKPVVAVGYGWHAAASALRHLHDVFERLGAHQASRNAQLTFMQQINPDGTVIDEAYVDKELSEAIDSLRSIL